MAARREAGRAKSGQVEALSFRVRLVAVVIAVTMLVWMLAQWLGGQFGWDPRYVFLFDFAALAAFFWALVVIWQIWRARRG